MQSPERTTRDAISKTGRLEMQSPERDDSRCNLPRGVGTTRDTPGTALARHGAGRWWVADAHLGAQMYTASPGAEMGTCMLALARRAATPLVAHVARDHRRRDEHKQGANDELLRPAHLQASLGAECAQLGCGREAQPCEEEGAPVGKTGRRDEQLHAGVALRGRGRISLRSLAVRVP